MLDGARQQPVRGGALVEIRARPQRAHQRRVGLDEQRDTALRAGEAAAHARVPRHSRPREKLKRIDGGERGVAHASRARRSGVERSLVMVEAHDALDRAMAERVVRHEQ